MNKFISNISKYILIVFITIQSFIYTLSFIDGISTNNDIFNKLVTIVYHLRNVCYLLSPFIVVFYKRLKLDVIFMYIFCILICAITNIFFPQNAEYLSNVTNHFKYILMIYLVIRSKLLDFNFLCSFFIKTSRVTYILLILFFITQYKNININSLYMTFSNAICILICILLYSGIILRKKFDVLLSISGLITLLLYGSRGSLIFTVLYLTYICYLKYKNQKKKIYFFVLSSATILLITILFINQFIEILEIVGISGRTFESILSGDFFKSSARLDIYRYLLNVLKDNWFIGIGLCGDRYYLPFRFTGVNATYAHNIILELLLDFGIPIGFLIIMSLIILIYFKYCKEKKVEIKAFYAIFLFTNLLQLMVSRSWLTEYNLFLFFALICTYSNSKIVNHRGVYEI